MSKSPPPAEGGFSLERVGNGGCGRVCKGGSGEFAARDPCRNGGGRWMGGGAAQWVWELGSTRETDEQEERRKDWGRPVDSRGK
jgi:hypothetical protein